MNERLVLYAILYKIACLAAGLACIFMGYELFMAGILSPEGLKAAAGSNTIELANAAPGTVFAAFGAAVIGLVVTRGLDFDVQGDAQGRHADGVHVHALLTEPGQSQPATAKGGAKTRASKSAAKGAGKVKATATDDPATPKPPSLHVAAR